MSKVYDRGGKMKVYSADERICQKSKKIPSVNTLLDVFREMGTTEETLKSLKEDLHFTPV